jgi:hypothetical protein
MNQNNTKIIRVEYNWWAIVFSIIGTIILLYNANTTQSMMSDSEEAGFAGLFWYFMLLPANAAFVMFSGYACALKKIPAWLFWPIISLCLIVLFSHYLV